MAVQIPVLERTEAPEPASVGRVQFKPANPEPAMEADTAALTALGGTAEKYVQTQQAFAADTAANKAASDLHGQLDRLLNGDAGQTAVDGTVIRPATVGAKQKQGDPAAIYQQFDKDNQAATDSVFSQYKDASDLTKAMVAKKLQQVNTRFYNLRTTAYGTQNTTYIQQTTDAAVKVAQTDAVDDITTQVDPENPESLKAGDQSLNKIADLVNAKGAKLGLATPILDPTGKKDPITKQPVVIGYKDQAPQIKEEIAKAYSETVKNSIEALTVPGDTDLDSAKAVMDRYGKFLDAVHKPKMEERIVKAEIDKASSDAFSEVKELPYAEAMKELNNNDFADSSDPDKARAGAMAKLSTYRTQMENAKTAQARDNFVAAGQIVYQKQQGKSPYATKDAAMYDPAVSQLLQEATPDQIKAIGSLVEPPNKSDPASVNSMYSDLGDINVMKNMTFDQLVEKSAGLNTADATTFRNAFNAFHVAKPNEQSVQLSYMNKILEDQMNDLGKSNREVGVKKDSYGHYKTADQLKLNAVKQKLYENADTLSHMSNKDQQEYVKGIVADTVKNHVTTPGFFESMFGSAKSYFGLGDTSTTKKTPGPPTGNTSATPGVPPGNARMQGMQQALQAFQKQKGRPPSDSTELNNFIKNGK